MSYTGIYAIRYQIPILYQKTEVAVITAAQDIHNEDPATPDHTNRLNWATWANKNSNMAWEPFIWPVAMNPTIQSSVETDPTGQSVADTDVQFVVNSNLNAVIADFVAHPPPGA